jgi:hypothetical protein
MSKSKLNDVKALLARDNYDVFMISETWLWTSISNEEITIDGYQLKRCDRTNIKAYNSRGGGVVEYIKNEYTVEHHEHSFSFPEKVQAAKFTIKKVHLKQIVFFAIYRVPDTHKKFIQEMDTEIYKHGNDEIYIVGDLNIDQTKYR